MARLHLHNASKSFGKKKLLDDISFQLATGEILGLFGKNGSGKSTLLKMIFGTEKADAINLSISDQVIKPSEVIKEKEIAYLPQISMLPRHLKVREIIPIYFSEEEKQDSLFYDPLLAKITARRISELSMGEVRYLEILLVGNLNHPFVLLDEPFYMIDPLYRIEIQKILKKLQSKKAILITDHYYSDVLSVTTKNLLLKEGKIYSISNTQDLENLEYLGKNKT